MAIKAPAIDNWIVSGSPSKANESSAPMNGASEK